MSSPDRLSLPEMIAAAIAGTKKNLPDKSVKAITVTNKSVRLELADAAIVRHDLTASEQRIVDAIGAGPDLTSEEVAAKLNRSPESNLRNQLSGMRTRGILSGEKGEAGYGVTPLYLSPR